LRPIIKRFGDEFGQRVKLVAEIARERQWLSEIEVGTEPTQTRAHTRSMQQCRQGCICMI
jgi:hypothetical protein